MPTTRPRPISIPTSKLRELRLKSSRHSFAAPEGNLAA